MTDPKYIYVMTNEFMPWVVKVEPDLARVLVCGEIERDTGFFTGDQQTIIAKIKNVEAEFWRTRRFCGFLERF